MAQFPSQSSASGLWSLKKQKRAEQGDNWPPLFGPADDYFEYVTMLLPGNGTNGAQNNTFLDSSTNNFTITRNGNTTQGTFSPYVSNWSNYFDGSGDRLEVADAAAMELGSGNWTIELWVNTTNSTPYSALFTRDDGGVTAGSYVILLNTASANGIVTFWSADINGFSAIVLSSGSVSCRDGAWHHIAVVRNSNTLTMYIDGVSTSTASYSGAFGNTAQPLKIGSETGYGRDYTGYISNVRLVVGTAVYTSNFTPSTSPLTAITNTQLLTCQSNRFIDNSTNNFTITRVDNVSVQRFSPFSPTTPYAAGTIGGSGYFDGSGDYLNVTAQTALGMGAGDFTYEAWIYVNEIVTANAVRGLFDSRVSGATGCGIYTSADGGTTSRLVYATNSAIIASSSITITPYTWTHIAVTRSSGTVRGFINGTLQFTTTDSRTFSSSASTYIAADVNLSYFNGYINDARILKGTAQYTSAFTPPSAPLTAITNTSLLLSYTNGGIIDNAMMNDLETVGNAQISAAQSKFGGGSIAFDGSGDALALPANINLAVGGGDFTIEMWVNGANNGSTVGGSYPRLFTFGTAQTSGCIECYNAAGTMYIEIFGVSSITFTASTLLNSTWNHYAITRSGTSLRAFVNGTQVGTTATNSTNINLAATTQSWIGAISASAGNFNGYLDDLRITKGYARYTANFTPPAAPFPTY